MKLHREFEQGSVEWMTARAGIPTASEFDALVSPTFEIRNGEMPQTYLNKKLAEKWLGGPLPGFNTFDMDQGRILEEEAVPWYEFTMSETIERVGFITTDDGRIGCSPDGLLGDNCGIEIKCPEPHTHVKYLRSGGVPKEYLAQVHGGMFVSGLSMWRFLSYRRNFPPLVLTVERDEKIQAILREALDKFLADFDREYFRMCERNGGEPKSARKTVSSVEEEEAIGITP